MCDRAMHVKHSLAFDKKSIILLQASPKQCFCNRYHSYLTIKMMLKVKIVICSLRFISRKKQSTYFSVCFAYVKFVTCCLYSFPI